MVALLSFPPFSILIAGCFILKVKCVMVTQTTWQKNDKWPCNINASAIILLYIRPIIVIIGESSGVQVQIRKKKNRIFHCFFSSLAWHVQFVDRITWFDKWMFHWWCCLGELVIMIFRVGVTPRRRPTFIFPVCTNVCTLRYIFPLICPFLKLKYLLTHTYELTILLNCIASSHLGICYRI